MSINEFLKVSESLIGLIIDIGFGQGTVPRQKLINPVDRMLGDADEHAVLNECVRYGEFGESLERRLWMIQWKLRN